MHDVLLKLGRDIVVHENVDPRKRSRLWDAKDVYRVLREQGTEKVESIYLDLSENKEIDLSPAAFEGMCNLRLLKFYYPRFLKVLSREEMMIRGERVRITLPQGLHFLSNELRILDWPYYPLKSLPSNFFPENLVVLKMPGSHLEHLWNDYQPLENLKLMILRYSNLIFSDFDFSNLPNLESLIFGIAKKLASLPSSIGKLTCLVKLQLCGCCELASLPESIGELKSLEELWLLYCKKLASLPSSIGGLKSLVKLKLNGCSELASLPESIGELECLETLDLSGFSELASLPESIGELKRLETLDLFYCPKLASLPNSIYGLESLESLNLEDCSKLNRFPILNPRRSEVEEIASTTNKLGCLQSLNMTNCHVLEIPGSIGSWVSLTTLRLYGSDCERIPATIAQLPVLTELDLYGCKRLQHLPQLPSSLRVLIASDCISLTSVEGIFMQGCDDYEAASQEFDFFNCPQLDQSSLTKIIVDARLRIERMATSLFNQQYFGEPVSVRLCIPGSEVPEWFTYKNTGGPTAHWHRANTTDQLFGFTLCAVVSFGYREEEYLDDFDIKCECHLITKDGIHSDLSFQYDEDGWGTWEREHVFIWSIHSDLFFKEASFHFKPLEESDDVAVVQSGVHPLFVEDCIDEPEQPQPKRLKLMGNA
ncbi:hypothetical protein OIU77_018538 [Salix suchowensis]|uniref:Uncharacterized protein n=1 Tax=Salix suchowensis TaxID=1278906 RepID=A0ABQ9CEX2_9ROSI|nr:hypothetical protein OIU77_018538 [Salix suchowensis]